MALFSNAWITYSYDRLSRLSLRTVGDILTEHQTYLAGSGTCTTTTLPETFYTTAKGSSSKLSGFRYAYNEVGNVTQITNLVDGTYQKFAYDKLGQLQYVTDYGKDGTAYQRYKYYYDNAGNLTSWVIQDGTGTITGVEHTYTYGDANCKDLLTAFDGQSITYDGGGNPLSYYNGKRYTMAWRNGKELDTLTTNGKTTGYEYDVDGLRTRKTNPDGSYSDYYWLGKLLLAEQRYDKNGSCTYTLRFSYDENDSPIGVAIKSGSATTFTPYYYAKNVQGDVIGLYQWNYSSTGTPTSTKVATYSYDPWGNFLGAYNASGSKITAATNAALLNPLRYRGYYYDSESGFYYLQSRYYDPQISRFINADSYASTGRGFLGYNMFAYCGNKPTTREDSDGHFWLTSIIIGVAVQYVQDVIENLSDGKTGIDILIPTSTVGEYVAAGVTALIPGSGFCGALARNVVAEGITVAGNLISGKGNVNIAESMGKVAIGTLLDGTFEKLSKKVTNCWIDSKVPKNYSTYVHIARQSNPNLTRTQIYDKMYKSGKRCRAAAKAVSLGFEIARTLLSYCTDL